MAGNFSLKEVADKVFSPKAARNVVVAMAITTAASLTAAYKVLSDGPAIDAKANARAVLCDNDLASNQYLAKAHPGYLNQVRANVGCKPAP